MRYIYDCFGKRWELQELCFGALFWSFVLELRFEASFWSFVLQLFLELCIVALVDGWFEFEIFEGLKV
jgi:hypothetical protein